jgi:hypothetical protein
LETNIEDDLAARDSVEGVRGLDKAVFGLEVDEFLDDAIGFNGAPLTVMR